MRASLLLSILLITLTGAGCGSFDTTETPDQQTEPVTQFSVYPDPCALVNLSEVQALPAFAGLGAPSMTKEQKTTYPYLNKCVVAFPDPRGTSYPSKLLQVLIYASRDGFDASRWYHSIKKGAEELALQTDAAYTITIGDEATKLGAIRQPQKVIIGGKVSDAYYDGTVLHMLTDNAVVDITAGTLFGNTLADAISVAKTVAKQL